MTAGHPGGPGPPGGDPGGWVRPRGVRGEGLPGPEGQRGVTGGSSPGGKQRRWHAELAWLARGARVAEGRIGGLRADVLIEASGERFAAVTPGVPRGALPPGTVRLPGLTLPGLANAHSHAFHRALRGTAEADEGTFWTWRERMYRVAERLDPDSYHALARALYAEMALAGVTCVGEFHYVHHAAGGVPYADPNELGRCLLQAASDAGLRITLLDTCYLSGGLSRDGRPQPLDGVRLRFGDGSPEAWASRLGAFGGDQLGMLGPHARLGAAVHSVRAVPPDAMPEIMTWAHKHGAPVHAHLSEQPLENAECQAAYGRTPAEVMYEAGVLTPRSTMVHATHLSRGDIELLGGCQTFCCICPTTEADLADGIGPAPALAAAGSPLSLGSDGHTVVDLLAEARWLELSQRLATRRRVHFTADELAVAATVTGHACLGWPDAGEIVPGAYADLVTVSLDSPRLAGSRASPDSVLAAVFLTGTAADVRHVVISGRDVVRDGRHLLVDDVPGELATAISAVLP
ncbi:MAG: formimidoylglutamate deiminase [Streptosporangiaceae bacterium]|nr:formimidoylglutamate deiminase [Streptosporangiaceae bacterium]MBV9855567.1 formimidoylglutamate deiminase [Streptosporangiaceae bacterium]